MTRAGAVLASGSSGGAMGFLVIALLILATVVLIRSMSKRLANVKRNAEHWPDSETGDADTGDNVSDDDEGPRAD